MSATQPAERTTPASLPRVRVVSVDLVRGAVMVLMALDHVRVFSGLPAGGPTPAIFFTRWITHFCAPAFIFLAGSSAFLQGRGRPGLSRRLLLRGAWLVLLELTLLRLAWTFNLDYGAHALAGVIWCIGWCMIALAALVKLPLGAVVALGVALVAGHNLVDPHIGQLLGSLEERELAWLWKILYVGFWADPIRLGSDLPELTVLYALVPWIGVMALGYAFGRVLTLEPARRDRMCLALGLGALGLFVLLRGFDLYGDPRPWRGAGTAAGGPARPAVLAFLDTTKYPASLAFLLMTLGPTLALIPAFERARGALARGLTVFGRVPFFFYLLHIPLIHALALLVSWLREGAVNPWLFASHPMHAPPAPPGYTWSLALLYLVWAATIALLHPLCRWFARLKARRMDWWLSYL